MEKNIYQKAKEYGLIEGYVPENCPIATLNIVKALAAESEKDEYMNPLTSILKDVISLIEVANDTVETIVKAYEQDHK